MPPPAALDPWLAGRHFGIVIDAGSSGSRLQIYSWKDPIIDIVDQDDAIARQLPAVEKGTVSGDDWVHKVEPGISSFADDTDSLPAYLRPLLNHAREQIPPSLHAETPLFLLATAGMRLLSPEKQADILRETCHFLVLHSHFKVDSPSSNGPCGSSVRIITGEEEGLFGWIAVNYLMDGFTRDPAQRTTYGFLDMGGASTQIAFEPGEGHEDDSDRTIDVRLRLLNGEEIHHKVFVTTWLGYGTNKARERYVAQAISDFEEMRTDDNDLVPDPCLPKDLSLAETPFQSGSSSEHSRKSHQLIGTGSFEQCIEKTSPLLNNTAPCSDSPCLMNGIHVPPIDFSVSHFIGVSEYWFSSEHVFGLGGPYDFVQYEKAASNFCSRDWNGIVQQHEADRQKGYVTGDGEVEKDGVIVDVGRWGENVELSRLQMQCFKAAWIVNVLHEGLGMPRLGDPGGNLPSEGDRVAEQAQSKGLGKPTFQSVDTVGDIAISWTLGKMVLEASKEVPLSSKTDRPLADPLDDIPDPSSFPIRPIRPLFDLGAIEDTIAPHLPSSLTRSSLGFSPVIALFFLAVFIMLIAIYPLRRGFRSFCLRTIRRASKRDITEVYSMEEGKLRSGFSSNVASRASQWLRTVQRFYSLHTRRSRPPPIFVPPSTPNLRQRQPTPPKQSPIRLAYFSDIVASASSSSRSPSPSPGFAEDANPNNALLSARSRNGSQMSLSSLVPRSTTISRVNNIHYMGDGVVSLGE